MILITTCLLENINVSCNLIIQLKSFYKLKRVEGYLNIGLIIIVYIFIEYIFFIYILYINYKTLAA
jgi:hypothetical protein